MSLAGVVNRVNEPPKLIQDETTTHYLLLDGGLSLSLLDDTMNLHFPESRRWVLENTEFDSEKESGLLIQSMDEEDIFLNHYVQQWSTEHLGIIIESKAGIDKLQQHLLNTISVDINDSKDLFFRWHEPRKLAGLLNTLNNEQVSSLLGPISKVYWCEYAHDEAHWYEFENLHIDNHPVQTHITIEKDQIEQLDEYDLYYYSRSLSRELIDEDKRPESITEEHFARAVLKNIKDALAINITHEDDVNHYIRIQLEHSNTIAEDKSIRAIFRDETLPPWKRLEKIQRELENR